MDNIPEDQDEENEDGNKDWLIVEEKKDSAESRPKIEFKEIAADVKGREEIKEEPDYDSL
jgi:hypothetical protein